MYIYSVTIHLQTDAEREWLDFMRNKHIQDVLNTGYFDKATIRKVMKEQAADTSTYNIEYITEHIEKYKAYATLAAPALQKDVSDRFAGRFTAERMLYEEINLS